MRGHLGTRAVAVGGRALLVWLVVAVVRAADRPLSGEELIATTVAAAVWLACLQTALTAVQYTLGASVAAAVGTGTGLVGVAALNPWLPGAELSPLVLLGAGAGVLATVTVWETIVRRTTARRRVLVVGTSALPGILQETGRDPRHPLDIIGSLPPAGAADDIAAVVEAQRPDLIVLTDAEEGWQVALDRLLEIKSPRFRVVGLTSFFEYAFGRVPLPHVGPMWFMSLLHLRQRPLHCWSKRVFDVTLAIALLIVTAPLLVLIALLVRRTPGPVLYSQTRVGEGGRPFTIYKFRTMVQDAEAPGRAVYADGERDHRVTGIGRLLRRTHLDELPQLWNVLTGDMSIVGPRPERPEFIADLEQQVPFWSRRLLVRPGLTGWAQVRCGYASDCATSAMKLSYDLWYLRNQGLVVDLAICVRTLVLIATLALFGSRSDRDLIPSAR